MIRNLRPVSRKYVDLIHDVAVIRNGVTLVPMQRTTSLYIDRVIPACGCTPARPGVGDDFYFIRTCG